MEYKNTNLKQVTDLMVTFQALASNLVWQCTRLIMDSEHHAGLWYWSERGWETWSERGWQTTYFTE